MKDCHHDLRDLKCCMPLKNGKVGTALTVLTKQKYMRDHEKLCKCKLKHCKM